jgi:translation initiation factor 3 subunit D
VPFAKSDKIGRIADWNATSDNASVAGDRGRGGRSGRGGRDGGAQSYGAGAAASTFAYFHGDDEATFSVVDNAKAAPRGRGGLASFSRGRGRGGARGGARGAAPTRGGARGTGRGGVAARGGAARRGGWKDWDKVSAEWRVHDAWEARHRGGVEMRAREAWTCICARLCARSASLLDPLAHMADPCAAATRA